MTDYVTPTRSKHIGDTPSPEPACCEPMEDALRFATESPRKVSGLQYLHVFNSKTGQHVWSPVGYVLPTRGRGATKTEGSTRIVQFCPFCGKKQKGRPNGVSSG